MNKVEITKDILPLTEYFTSIEGECLDVGKPTIFVRTYGCNIKCTKCDTKNSWEGNNILYKDVEELSFEIFNLLVNNEGIRRISFTGGNPLLHYEKLLLLRNNIMSMTRVSNIDIKFNLEHPGTISTSPPKSLGAIEEINLVKTMYTIIQDIKMFMGNSEEEKRNLIINNFFLLDFLDTVIYKVLIETKEDVDIFLTSFAEITETKPSIKNKLIYFSILRDEDNIINEELFNYITENCLYKIPNSKFNYPMHVSLNFR